MSARRSKTSTRIHSAIRGTDFVEQLEKRLFLTTVITDTNPLTTTPATQTFEYKDARNNTIRIQVHGDVSVEFIFGRMTKGADETGAGGNILILGDHIEPTRFDKGKLVANTEDGRDLFHIYVAQATLESFISIAQVPVFSAENRPMQPFSGSIPIRAQQINFGNDTGRGTLAGTGVVWIGARTRDTDADIENEENRPVIVSTRFYGHGLMPPNSTNRLIAGFSTATDVTLGRFLLGGTITGNVYITGSMGTFYAGNILTGNAQGHSLTNSQAPGNFFVGGDIRDIIVKGSIGTDSIGNSNDDRKRPVYTTGTDFNIRGKVGQIRVGGDYAATGTIYNTNPGKGLRARQDELEMRINPNANRGSFSDFQIGELGDNEPLFTNDTFEGAQFLGSINSKTSGDNVVQVNGLYQRISENVSDIADFYAVPLMAGQRVTVQLVAPFIFDVINQLSGFQTELRKSPFLHVGVFDPDRRLIATDWSNAGAWTNGTPTGDFTGATGSGFDPAQQEVFSFTAEKPGIYYFAVGETPGFDTAPTRIGTEQPYTLNITGVGNLGLGGLSVDDTIFGMGGFRSLKKESLTGYDANIEVVRGDLGAVISQNDYIISNFDGLNALAIGGNLRAVDAISLGQVEGTDEATGRVTYASGALLGSVAGSVGMIRSRGTDSDAHGTIFNDVGRQAGTRIGFITIPTVIGGDIQYIVSPTTLICDAAANGNIGVVQANQFGVSSYPGSLSANADGRGRPGIIELIDVTGDLGTLNGGGPVIATGPGGNVRYIHLSDSSTAYRPFLFGGSQPEETEFLPGQVAVLTDDSGAQVRILPTREELIDPLTGQPQLDPITLEPLNNHGALTVLTYPIARSPRNAGGGGVVIIRVESTRGVEVQTTGGTTEIGAIVTGTADPGPALLDISTLDPFFVDFGPDGIQGTGDDPFGIDPLETNTLSVILRGSLIDVYRISGSNYDTISNSTAGEIVNTRIGTVRRLEANNLGWARSVTTPGMAIEQSTVADNPGSSETDGATFPFDQAKNAIVINGGGPSNPAVVDLRTRESLGNVMIVGRAQNITANYDKGVRGVFEGIIGAVYANGQLRNVNIGEGLNPSGTGNRSIAGLYANALNPIPDTGVGRIENVTNQGLNSDIRGDIVAGAGIGNITLRDGSIINADIQSFAASGQDGIHTGTGADFIASREFGGTAVISTVGNIDRIDVIGLGGIIGLLARVANIGTVTSVGGFGIINSTFTVLGAGRFGAVTADGYGVRGVLWRGGQSIDGVTAIGAGTKRLGTTGFAPSVRFSESFGFDPFFGTRPNPMTDLHVVIGTTAANPTRKGTSTKGSIDLSTLQVSRDVGYIRANTIRASLFNVGNNVAQLTTVDYIDSLEMTAGRIDQIAVGKDILRTSINTSGPIAQIAIGGNMRGSASILALGDNGTIGTAIVKGNQFGNLYAQQSFAILRVGKGYGSQGTATAGNMTEFTVKGNVFSSADLRVEKRLGALNIGGDLEEAARIRVGTLGTKNIAGQEIGEVDTKPWNS